MGADDAIEIVLGADIDAGRWILEHQQPRLGGQCAAEEDLLLIATGKSRDEMLG
jgi:hypothetical protein